MLFMRVLLAAGALLLTCIALAQESPKQDRVPSAAVADQRSPIALSEAEIAFVRREMRGLLESLRDILDASANADRAGVVAAARRAGLNGPEAEHIPSSLAPKLPPEFRKLGLATHRAFDQIALDVERSGAIDSLPKALAEAMGNCVACHSTWRVATEGQR
jgi:hypothetical protein